MKNIKDYLHLYIGCDVAREHDEFRSKTFSEYGKLVGVSSSEVEAGKTVAVIGVGLEHFHEWYAEETKPVLRPLSDMTEDEAVQIAIIMYGQPDSVRWRMEDKGNYFNVYRKHYSESFTIDKASGDIDRYSKEGDQMELQTTLQHHFITRYLLSKGFDLFGLIEAGLAIDKTTLIRNEEN